MRKYKVGNHVPVKPSGGRIVEATIKAVVETTEGMRLQVSFGEETALIYPWQMVQSDAEGWSCPEIQMAPEEIIPGGVVFQPWLRQRLSCLLQVPSKEYLVR
jgi:hypothetical protein